MVFNWKKIDWKTIKLHVYAKKKVYSSILDISKSSNDAGLEDFLDDFIKEQLEAQYDLGMRLKQLEIIGKDGHGIVDYDKNMF